MFVLFRVELLSVAHLLEQFVELLNRVIVWHKLLLYLIERTEMIPQYIPCFLDSSLNTKVDILIFCHVVVRNRIDYC